MKTGRMAEKLKHHAVDEHKRERASGEGRSNGATRKDGKGHASRVSRANPRLDKSTILDQAIEVIGDKGEAMRWLGTPVRALGYATPISLLHDVKGRKSVIAILSRLEHGMI
jgi:putative toxin-antitoxin system antitoxin component (TIGR02293 family)